MCNDFAKDNFKRLLEIDELVDELLLELQKEKEASKISDVESGER